MTEGAITLRGGPIFDGQAVRADHALCLEGGVVTAFGPSAAVPGRGREIDLAGDILSPGYVDLQVNGGDGIMFNDAPTAETLARMAAAHRRLGTVAFLPTLITDTPEITAAAIAATEAALAAGTPGIAGLHLEGPHLSLARKGAHDPALIREMTEADCDQLCAAAARLPVLLVTIAPESVSLAQVARLARAGVLLSLGHTDTDYATALAYHRAGVRLVTHLFNAMRQLGNREPGVVGAALDAPDLSCGLIADGIHVHPAVMRAALAAKREPGAVFLVSDAMAPAGSEIASFELNGRLITRAEGRLTLGDGTLAGADLALTRAVQVLIDDVGVPLGAALAAATSVPAGIAGLAAGRIAVGAPADLIRIETTLAGCCPI